MMYVVGVECCQSPLLCPNVSDVIIFRFIELFKHLIYYHAHAIPTQLYIGIMSSLLIQCMQVLGAHTLILHIGQQGLTCTTQIMLVWELVVKKCTGMYWNLTPFL